MLIEAGFDIAFECPAQTPMLLQLNVHPSRETDLLSPDRIASDPPLPMRSLSRSVRQPGHAGRGSGRARHLLRSLRHRRLRRCLTDRRRMLGRRRSPIFPTTSLLYLVSSRYCDSDKLADFAWSQFGKHVRRRRAWCRRFAISSTRKIRFSYPDARSTRAPAIRMHEGIGVCRDFAHLAIALCRCMNIPARYCTGYLGDIGVPPDVDPDAISAPGSRSFSTAAGARWTRATTIPASAGSSWAAAATPPTSRSRPPSASPNSCVSR